MTATLTAPRLVALSRPNPLLTRLTLFVALAAVPLMAAYGLDNRLFQGDSVWLKPLKFHLALTVYTGSLVLYGMLLPEGTFTTRRWRIYIGVVALFRAPAPQRWKYAFSAEAAQKTGITLGAHACSLSVSMGAPVNASTQVASMSPGICP